MVFLLFFCIMSAVALGIWVGLSASKNTSPEEIAKINSEYRDINNYINLNRIGQNKP